MELFLNLAWLAIALGSLAWWWRRTVGVSHHPHRRREALFPLLALVCALAVFFPVISVTDDLHAELAVMEDSSAWRRSGTFVGGNHGSSGERKLISPPALLPSSITAPAFTFVAEKLNVIDFCRPIEATRRSLAARAPPTL